MKQFPIIELHPDQIRVDPRNECRCTVMKHSIVMSSSIGSVADLERRDQCACARSRVERVRIEGAA